MSYRNTHPLDFEHSQPVVLVTRCCFFSVCGRLLTVCAVICNFLSDGAPWRTNIVQFRWDSIEPFQRERERRHHRNQHFFNSVASNRKLLDGITSVQMSLQVNKKNIQTSMRVKFVHQEQVISLFESQGHPSAPFSGRFSGIKLEVSPNRSKHQTGLLGQQARFCLYLCQRLSYSTQATHGMLLL